MYRLRFPFERKGTERARTTIASNQTMRRFGDDNLIRPRFLLQTGRDIGGIPDGGIIHPQVITDSTYDDHARVETHPEGELNTMLLCWLGLVCLELTTQLQGGEHRAASVILVGKRGAKEGHEAVTQELINGPFVTMDRAEGQLKELVQDGMHDLWPKLFSQARRVGQITKEYGDLLPLTFERRMRDENSFNEVLRCVDTWLTHRCVPSKG